MTEFYFCVQVENSYVIKLFCTNKVCLLNFTKNVMQIGEAKKFVIKNN